MSNNLVNFELQEKDLQLVVSEKTLGSLTTNAKQIKAMVEFALPNYDIANYGEDNIALAKKDKAMLNAASKALNDKRIKLEKEFMQPFSEFKGVIGDTITLIKECSSKIDAVVKQSEENERASKRAEITAIWDGKSFTLIPLEKVFDNKWLNKSTSLKTVESDIDSKISEINSDISTIEAIGEDTDLLKSLYLDTLNLNNTIQYAARLRENKERAREEVERRAQAAQATAPVIKTAAPAPEATREPAPVVYSAPISDQNTLVRAFKVTCTKEKIIALAKYMDEQNIAYEKIDLDAEAK